MMRLQAIGHKQYQALSKVHKGALHPLALIEMRRTVCGYPTSA